MHSRDCLQAGCRPCRPLPHRCPAPAGLWNTVLRGEADATWCARGVGVGWGWGGAHVLRRAAHACSSAVAPSLPYPPPPPPPPPSTPTRVFMGWEGVEAELKGVELNTFRVRMTAAETGGAAGKGRGVLQASAPQQPPALPSALSRGRAGTPAHQPPRSARTQLEDYGIPYGYSPVLVAAPGTLA